jgi:hypothetical protein
MRRTYVNTELRERVLRRDGYTCFLKRMDASHVCRSRLTVDHVHMAGGMMGKRAPDDEQHLVALCLDWNVVGVRREVRQAQREYLKALYP